MIRVHVPNSPYGLCGHKADIEEEEEEEEEELKFREKPRKERRSCTSAKSLRVL